MNEKTSKIHLSVQIPGELCRLSYHKKIRMTSNTKVNKLIFELMHVYGDKNRDNLLRYL